MDQRKCEEICSWLNREHLLFPEALQHMVQERSMSGSILNDDDDDEKDGLLGLLNALTGWGEWRVAAQYEDGKVDHFFAAHYPTNEENSELKKLTNEE